MNQHDPTRAPRLLDLHSLNNPSNAESRCPLAPEFEESDGTTRVRMNCESYVRLLVGARETDPCAWPPGLEDGAALVERARQIEDECVTQYGEFDPEKLSAVTQDEYLNIHLTLDELQEGIQDACAPDGEHVDKSPSAPLPNASWQEFSVQHSSENFA